MNVRKYAQALVPVAALATSACSMTSEGLELKLEEEGGQALVTLDWQSSDDASGTMIASFPDGRSFRGTYFRITPDTPVEQLEPLWEGWTEARDWPHWQPGANFLEHYSGKHSTGAAHRRKRRRTAMSRDGGGRL
jgi:hypothetical protein